MPIRQFLSPTRRARLRHYINAPPGRRDDAFAYALDADAHALQRQRCACLRHGRATAYGPAIAAAVGARPALHLIMLYFVATIITHTAAAVALCTAYFTRDALPHYRPDISSAVAAAAAIRHFSCRCHARCHFIAIFHDMHTLRVFHTRGLMLLIPLVLLATDTSHIYSYQLMVLTLILPRLFRT